MWHSLLKNSNCIVNFLIVIKEITEEEYMFAHEVVGKHFLSTRYEQSEKGKRKNTFFFSDVLSIFMSHCLIDIMSCFITVTITRRKEKEKKNSLRHLERYVCLDMRQKQR